MVRGTEVNMLGEDDETREGTVVGDADVNMFSDEEEQQVTVEVDMVGDVEVNTPEHTGISGVVEQPRGRHRVLASSTTLVNPYTLLDFKGRKRRRYENIPRDNTPEHPDTMVEQPRSWLQLLHHRLWRPPWLVSQYTLLDFKKRKRREQNVADILSQLQKEEETEGTSI